MRFLQVDAGKKWVHLPSFHIPVESASFALVLQLFSRQAFQANGQGISKSNVDSHPFPLQLTQQRLDMMVERMMEMLSRSRFAALQTMRIHRCTRSGPSPGHTVDAVCDAGPLLVRECIVNETAPTQVGTNSYPVA